MHSPNVPCAYCGNDTELTKPLLRTYNAIGKLGNPTVPELVDHLKERVHHTAINRRVERLLEKNLIKRKTVPHDGIRYSQS